MENTRKLSIKYEGSSVANGEMEVVDLISSVGSFVELVNHLNRDILGNKDKLKIQITGFKPGSFEIFFNFEYQNIIEALIKNTNSLDEIYKILFGSNNILGFFSLIKFTKNKLFELIETNGETSIIKNEIGKQANTYNFSIKLFEGWFARNTTYNFTGLVNKEGYDSIKVNSEGEELEIVNKNSVQYFSTEIDNNQETTEITVEYLTIDTIQFDSSKWKFRIEPEEVFWAKINDIQFLHQFNSREIVFGKGDILECEIKVIKGIREGKTFKDREILLVKEIKPAKKPQALL